MSSPYLLYSDVHFHRWDAFASLDAFKVNSRLQIIIKELLRAYEEAAAAGVKIAFCAGDLFHVRGSASPDVLLPVEAFYVDVFHRTGIKTYCIAGNHDLGSNDYEPFHDMTSVLGSCPGFFGGSAHYVDVGWGKVLMNAWNPKLNDLECAMKAEAEPDTDLIIHAPLNGVLNIPGHGFEPSQLAAWGFRRVFAGHYHNHKAFEDGKVYSIGASTHQTFSDIGTRAGFCLVYPDRVDFRESHAPQFIDLDLSTVEEGDIPLIVDGHYVRATVNDATNEQVAELRGLIMTGGALGCQVRNITTKGVTSRSTTSSMDSLEESVEKFAQKKAGLAVAKNAARILADVRGAA